MSIRGLSIIRGVFFIGAPIILVVCYSGVYFTGNLLNWAPIIGVSIKAGDCF